MTISVKLLGLVCGIAMLALAAEPAPMKIYIEPQDGFESYISAAIVRKQAPVVVTTNRGDAVYMLTSSVKEQKESTGGKIARCAFAYCAGINGTQTATVQLVNADGVVLWAYNVRKSGAASYQSSAEAIAKHLKEFLEKLPKPKKQ
jgi:hypothetical protein